ncbi:gem-associated protein 8 isoform X1 [Equus asinus]|uniref:Gem nuclear organelle associated protein 8 n=2 Tax=Equus asinus TaxID=9793 RepID=A0A9L0JGB1_EQUAS|nr:gem-associated protein 8 isoform X1 [Equus asinus]XP_014713164.2 gem-associated protein 8 isoform X1 [Equus asinus]XP_044620373.1 gem-associated protein 8 isoform X1 [Equus asinus]XP_044620374.1 gem-associated protein 8 isoform X1 [Equus asinus]
MEETEEIHQKPKSKSTTECVASHPLSQALTSGPSQQAVSSKAAEPWSAHPVYARYWQHYQQAMAWMHSHQNAYRKAVESYFSSPWYFPPAALSQSSHANEGGSPQSFYDHHSASQGSGCNYSHSRRSGQHPHDSTREDQTWSAEEEVETESDGGVECDVSNMEITEELRQYFAETERHREERRRQQQLEAARLADYVNADHDLYYNPRRSAEPPAERPGERRQAEMKRLYGDSAAKIQAMEAAVQLSFDKHCDRKQPKYWPVIPLKF